MEAIDTPFLDVDDEEGLISDVKAARQLGFTGKACINPRQIEVIHVGFAPSLEEIAHVRRVIQVIADAEREGNGVVALDGKMVDAPFVALARRVLAMAEAVGLKT